MTALGGCQSPNKTAGFQGRPAGSIRFCASVSLDIRQNVDVVGIVEGSEIRSGPLDLA
jgi:hypothetical protein